MSGLQQQPTNGAPVVTLVLVLDIPGVVGEVWQPVELHTLLYQTLLLVKGLGTYRRIYICLYVAYMLRVPREGQAWLTISEVSV